MLRFAMSCNLRGVLMCLAAGISASASCITTVNYAPDRLAPPNETAQIVRLPDTIYDALAGIGGPTLFVTFDDFETIDGLFRPASYGVLDGQFVAAGVEFAADAAKAWEIGSARQRTQIAAVIGTLQFANDIVAPARFEPALPDIDGDDGGPNADLVDTILSGGITLTIPPLDWEFVRTDLDAAGDDKIAPLPKSVLAHNRQHIVAGL